MVWRTRHFALLVSLTLAGCTAIAGLGEFDDVAGADGGEAASGGRGATASSGQGGGGGALACDCRPAAEAPFQGPFALEDGPTCAGGQPVRTLGVAPSVDDSCACTPGAVQCTPTATASGDDNCATQLGDAVSLTAGACLPVPTSGPTAAIQVAGPLTGTQACEAGPTPLVDYLSESTLCGYQGCDSADVCVPVDAIACVWAPVATGCPADYPQLRDQLVEATVACDCQPVTTSCTGQVTAYDDGGCSNVAGAITFTTSPQCLTLNMPTMQGVYLRYDAVGLGACGSPDPTVEIASSTLCCTAP